MRAYWPPIEYEYWVKGGKYKGCYCILHRQTKKKVDVTIYGGGRRFLNKQNVINARCLESDGSNEVPDYDDRIIGGKYDGLPCYLFARRNHKAVVAIPRVGKRYLQNEYVVAHEDCVNWSPGNFEFWQQQFQNYESRQQK